MNVIDFVRNLVHNLSPADLTILAGFLATALHYLLTKYQSFAKIVNWLLALVFPFVTTIAMILISSGSALKLYPWAVVVAQTVYQITEWIKRNAQVSAIDMVAKVGTDSPPTNPQF